MENTYNRSITISQPELMERAKSSLTGKWGMAAGAAFVYMLISAGSGIIPLGSLIVSGPLALGFAMFSLKLARGQHAELSNIFDGFNHFLNAFVTFLLSSLIIVAGFICLFVPGIIAALGLSQVYFLLADNPEMSATDVIKESWELMKGHKGDYFVLGLRFIPWIFLCILTLGIGLFWLLPYMQVTFANFHDSINPNQNNEDDILDHLVP